MMQTLEQKRAQHALNKVKQIERDYVEEKQEMFVSYVENLPSMILTNGFGQAVAMLLAQARGDRSDAHYLLYSCLEEWLCRDEPQAPYRAENDLMAAIVNCDRGTYLRAQAEALAWLEWMKKFAVAFLKNPGSIGR
ncbi:MAG TPA: type III-B CRISPR module-associated protein Cmr5 [Syntrophomonadaceae bacterium]|nr:type III-B CRISPR module-associated protein Cmr5 [Syntrophomonadaceae bacterium]